MMSCHPRGMTSCHTSVGTTVGLDYVMPSSRNDVMPVPEAHDAQTVQIRVAKADEMERNTPGNGVGKVDKVIDLVE